MLLKSDLFELLRVKGLDFQIHNHEPLYTVEDSEKFRGKIKGSHTKNLFLKNKKNSWKEWWLDYFDWNKDGITNWWEYLIPFGIVLFIEIIAELIASSII